MSRKLENQAVLVKDELDFNQAKDRLRKREFIEDYGDSIKISENIFSKIQEKFGRKCAKGIKKNKEYNKNMIIEAILESLKEENIDHIALTEGMVLQSLWEMQKGGKAEKIYKDIKSDYSF